MSKLLRHFNAENVKNVCIGVIFSTLDLNQDKTYYGKLDNDTVCTLLSYYSVNLPVHLCTCLFVVMSYAAQSS